MIHVAEIRGFGVDSTQQIIAEVGADASAFSSPANFASWMGVCPGSDESAEQNKSSRSAKGNCYVRRLLSQAAHAAVKKNGSHFQSLFRRFLPRLAYNGAIWATAHRLAHYIEQGKKPIPRPRNVAPKRCFRRSANLVTPSPSRLPLRYLHRDDFQWSGLSAFSTIPSALIGVVPKNKLWRSALLSFACCSQSMP